jgi:alpha 1,6-mannosyltransferase
VERELVNAQSAAIPSFKNCHTWLDNMLTFRKSVIAAAFVLTIIYLFTRSHSNAYAGSISSVTTEDKLAAAAAAVLANTRASSSNGAGARTGYVPSGPATTATSPKISASKQSSTQQVLKDAPNLSLVDQLAYQFPYDVETKFPAYIWQTWKYTPASADFGDDFRPAEASWTEKHPGFIHEVITDQVAVHLMRHLYASTPEVLEAYNAMPLPILKADFFRYLILLARGGIYSDIDTYALQSALDWIPESVPHEAVGLVIGIEADPDRPDWADWYSRRIQFCQWTIQAKSGHPVLREIVANVTQETLRRKKAGILSKIDDDKVVDFTGPAVWTDIIFDFFNSEKYFDMKNSKGRIEWDSFTGMTAPKKVGDVVILPITSFSPGVQQMGAGGYDDPMAFVRHEFEGMSCTTIHVQMVPSGSPPTTSY